VETYIQSEKLGDTVAQSIRNFYNVRNYQYAWFTSDGITEQGRGFWSLFGHADPDKKTTQKNLSGRMDSLVSEDSIISSSDSSFIRTEIGLTQEFLKYLNNNKEAAMAQLTNMQQFIPIKKWNPGQLADTILNRTDSSQMGSINPQYHLLKQQLNRLNTIAKNGGWPQVPATGKKLSKGTSSPQISLIKKRLVISGDFTTNDTSGLFNDTLELAIKSYQKRNGLKDNGIITDSLVKIMNIPVERRLEQVIINMNRAGWTPVQKDSNFIQVNIPAFMLYVYEGSSKAFDMPVVVGKEGTNTTMFTGNLNQIVFSPYWNIPESIVRDEILKSLKKDPNYLKKKNMEIVSRNDSLPKIRQLPGGDNSLGKAKFLFPNSFDIYFHDTPQKEHFKNQKRAYSHGCIRLADAAKMARYLLKNNPQWTPEKIQEAMNSDKEQVVKLDKQVPVVITYLTAWVDDRGQLNFREDIYGHDGNAAPKMFTNTKTI
jgi:murein L,D-transpeptidase YcbB/YkuD